MLFIIAVFSFFVCFLIRCCKFMNNLSLRPTDFRHSLGDKLSIDRFRVFFDSVQVQFSAVFFVID